LRKRQRTQHSTTWRSFRGAPMVAPASWSAVARSPAAAFHPGGRMFTPWHLRHRGFGHTQMSLCLSSICGARRVLPRWIRGAAGAYCPVRAMVLRKARQQLELRELAIPEPQRGQVLVRVRACAVCRTDLHVIDGELLNPKLPLVPGHEIVGRIETIGLG